MGKFGGFPGGGGFANMQNLMKQAQKMQAEVTAKQEEVQKKRNRNFSRWRSCNSKSYRWQSYKRYYNKKRSC